MHHHHSTKTAGAEPLSLLDRLTLLPVELQRNVLYEVLSESSLCVLALFVPDWGVCAHGADPVNAIYGLQRTDIYTRGVSGGAGATFESGVPHGGDHHVFFPLMKENARALTEQLRTRFPQALEWALRDLERGRMHCLQQAWPRGPDDDIGKCMATGAMVFRQVAPAVSAETGGLARHLMFNGVPSDPWLQMRLRRDPQTRKVFEMRHSVETGAGLFEDVEWRGMPQLETVFLDLRAYGRGAMEEEGIRRGAAKMGCLRLECLVIAGLRSGKRYVRPPGWEVCDWEGSDRETDGEVNWVKAFCGAVREGGRLVFVDRRMADLDWEGWRVRAEKEGLLPAVVEGRVDGEARYVRHVERALGQPARVQER